MDIKIKRPTKRDLEGLEKLKLQLVEARKGNNIVRVENKQKAIDRLKFKANIFNDNEKVEYIRGLMENAFHVKSDIVQDINVAEVQYKSILKIDKKNPEANYRYAFIKYQKRCWIEAINYFQKAQEIHRRGVLNFPLTEDQYIKSKLFIGYCAAQLAKEAIKEAATLKDGILNMEVKGISIEDLLDNLKDAISRTNVHILTKDSQTGISQEEYEEILFSLDNHQLLLSFIGDTPFIKKGSSENIALGGKLSNTLKRLLLNSKKGLPLTLQELNEWVEGEDGEEDLKWDNYRNRVRLLNEALVKIGYKENQIYAIRGKQRYEIKHLDFIIALGEEHHI